MRAPDRPNSNRAIALSAILFLLSACATTPGGPATTTAGSSPASSAATAGQPSQTAATPPIESPPLPTASAPQTYAVKVFFSKKPASLDDPSLVYPVSRTSPDLGVGTYAIRQLLAGPNAAEQAEGYFTMVKVRSGSSTCAGEDFTLKVEGGVATLQFCRFFDHVGVMSDGQAESEINATLKQFPTVNKVVILNSRGDCEFDLSGLNRCKQ